MDAVTFRNALLRCGVTQPEAQAAVPAQGYTTMVDFAQLSEDDIGQFVKSINKLPADANGIIPQIPFGSIKKLMAMRFRTIERQRLGLPVLHANFTLAELERVMRRMDYEAQKKINV